MAHPVDTPYVHGEVPDGALEAFDAALEILAPVFDVKRIVLSIAGGQDGLVQSACVVNRTSNRQLAKMLEEHAEAIRQAPPLEELREGHDLPDPSPHPPDTVTGVYCTTCGNGPIIGEIGSLVSCPNCNEPVSLGSQS